MGKSRRGKGKRTERKIKQEDGGGRSVLAVVMAGSCTNIFSILNDVDCKVYDGYIYIYMAVKASGRC